MSEHIQARNASQAYWTLDPHAIVKPGDPWFADLDRIVPREHYGIAHRLKKQLGAGAGRPEFVHVGLMGHAGIGKTTLARNALAELARDGIAPVYINALEAFDQGDFVFSDLMLVVAEAIIRHRILDTDQDRRMLKNSCVLPYDGVEWWDMHPGIRADELFLRALREAK